MTAITEGKYTFQLNTNEAFKFDETNKTSPHYHGLVHCGLKAVDIIATFPQEALFIEVKDFTQSNFSEKEEKVIADLAQKYRDTWLYRYGENQLNKPIRYICFIEGIDPKLLPQLEKRVAQQISTGMPQRWQQAILEFSRFSVVNLAKWNALLANIYGKVL